ncbi:MAG TPA: carboxymuconolactone decarboxylase family protein [Candidatus Dormibacteraeota bacterium]|nr:carboxymuconolactone decarboxylase family protein [Candidatus Dormibacteraeota bacterium]
MARLPYVEPGTSAAVDGLFHEIQEMGRPVLNLYRVLANQPPALDAFLEMSRYVRSESSLDPGLRELAILTTALHMDQPYELAHHTEAAARAGVHEVKVTAVVAGGPLDALTPAERAAVEFARQVAHTRTCDDVMFQRLQSLFSAAEIIDLVVTTGWYHLCAVILGSLRVELEVKGQ